MRVRNPTYVAALVLAACSSTAASGRGSGERSGSGCDSDDDCPAGEICIDSLFGPYCEPPKNRLCAENTDCATHQSCAIRDKTDFLCSYPGPTRTTCEPKKCAADWVCGAAYECSESWFNDAGATCTRRAWTADSGADG